jgi:prophage regulatory protein
MLSLVGVLHRPNRPSTLHLKSSNTHQGGFKMKRTILRIPAVKSESGLSRSTIYLRVSQGLWTKPVSLGARAVGWPSDEVEAINAARIAGKTDEEVRALVEKLEVARKAAK